MEKLIIRKRIVEFFYQSFLDYFPNVLIVIGLLRMLTFIGQTGMWSVRTSFGLKEHTVDDD